LSERRDLWIVCAGTARGSRTMANSRRVPPRVVVGLRPSRSRLKPFNQLPYCYYGYPSPRRGARSVSTTRGPPPPATAEAYGGTVTCATLALKLPRVTCATLALAYLDPAARTEAAA
jgi:hypothetical protein